MMTCSHAFEGNYPPSKKPELTEQESKKVDEQSKKKKVSDIKSIWEKKPGTKQEDEKKVRQQHIAPPPQKKFEEQPVTKRKDFWKSKIKPNEPKEQLPVKKPVVAELLTPIQKPVVVQKKEVPPPQKTVVQKTEPLPPKKPVILTDVKKPTLMPKPVVVQTKELPPPQKTVVQKTEPLPPKKPVVLSDVKKPIPMPKIEAKVAPLAFDIKAEIDLSPKVLARIISLTQEKPAVKIIGHELSEVSKTLLGGDEESQDDFNQLGGKVSEKGFEGHEKRQKIEKELLPKLQEFLENTPLNLVFKGSVNLEDGINLNNFDVNLLGKDFSITAKISSKGKVLRINISFNNYHTLFEKLRKIVVDDPSVTNFEEKVKSKIMILDELEEYGLADSEDKNLVCEIVIVGENMTINGVTYVEPEE
jgi:hypothetical protein